MKSAQAEMKGVEEMAHQKRVEDTLRIYIEKGISIQGDEAKLVCITGIFDYLSTAEVKPLLELPNFGRFRETVLAKIHEYKHALYFRKHRERHHRLNTVLDEMFRYLVQDDSIPRRRSERQKAEKVRRFNASFQYCSSAECKKVGMKRNELNAEVKASIVAEKKPVSIKVKVLPRRSARLRNML